MQLFHSELKEHSVASVGITRSLWLIITLNTQSPRSYIARRLRQRKSHGDDAPCVYTAGLPTRRVKCLHYTEKARQFIELRLQTSKFYCEQVLFFRPIDKSKHIIIRHGRLRPFTSSIEAAPGWDLCHETHDPRHSRLNNTRRPKEREHPGG